MKNLRPSILKPLRLFFTIGILIPIIYTIYKHWLNVRDTLLMANWQLVITGLLLLIVAQPLMALISWVILRSLEQFFPYIRIFTLYFVSQAAKYLPGGIWAFPGRVVAYQVLGVERSASLVSMVREVGILFIGAAIMGSAGVLGGLMVSDWVRLSIIVGLAICILAILLVQLPVFWRYMARFRYFKESGLQQGETYAAHYGFAWFPVALLVSLLFWAITGLAFREMAIGVSARVAGMSWFQAASIFALAWCAGFVIVIAPAGIGVRETVLSALLVAYMPVGEALSVALVARLWWTLAETVFILFSILKVSRSAIRPSIEEEKDQDKL